MTKSTSTLMAAMVAAGLLVCVSGAAQADFYPNGSTICLTPVESLSALKACEKKRWAEILREEAVTKKAADAAAAKAYVEAVAIGKLQAAEAPVWKVAQATALKQEAALKTEMQELVAQRDQLKRCLDLQQGENDQGRLAALGCGDVAASQEAAMSAAKHLLVETAEVNATFEAARAAHLKVNPGDFIPTIGMAESDAMKTEKFGERKRSNTTITAGHRTTQAIMQWGYLYFTDGVLTAIQY